MLRALLLVLACGLVGCAAIREARMAVPDGLAATAEESFGKASWGRSGSFALQGTGVRYERGADRLSLFEAFRYGKAPLRVQVDNGRHADCTARQGDISVGVVVAATQPWTLSCQWRGGDAPEGRLQIGEGRGQGMVQTREGEYRRGDVVLTLRSVHRLEGSAFPQPAAVGYELLHGGRAVGSVDMSRGTPVLRRPDPATAMGQAVTEAALALALVWEPT